MDAHLRKTIEREIEVGIRPEFSNPDYSAVLRRIHQRRHVPWSPKEFENIIWVNTFPMLCIKMWLNEKNLQHTYSYFQSPFAWSRLDSIHPHLCAMALPDLKGDKRVSQRASRYSPLPPSKARVWHLNETSSLNLGLSFSDCRLLPQLTLAQRKGYSLANDQILKLADQLLRDSF